MLRCAGFVGESLALRKDRIIRTRRWENWSPQLDSASPFRSLESRYVAHRSHATRGCEVSRQGAFSRASQSFEFSNDSGTSDGAKAVIESDIKHRTI